MSVPVSPRDRSDRVVEHAAKREPPPWERLTESDEHGALCGARLDHLVEVREPLVLVSQVQRSGSTLLGQLFDAHPECHAHPYEIRRSGSRTGTRCRSLAR